MVTQENKDDLKEVLNRIKFLKEDFEMLQDGRWSLEYSDGTEVVASIENCDKIIEAVGRLTPSESNECINREVFQNNLISSGGSGSKQRHAKYQI
jgi:hypothetical protein